MKKSKNLVPRSKWNIKCPYSMTPEYITVHNTENDASAENEISYMRSNNRQCSFHWAVDDKEAIQGVKENRNTWNAGKNLPDILATIYRNLFNCWELLIILP